MISEKKSICGLCSIPMLLILTIAIPAMALEITSDVQANLFVTDELVVLKVTGCNGSISYEVVDYFGHSVKKGQANQETAASGISLGTFEPGWYRFIGKENGQETTATFGVVHNRGDAPLPVDGRVCFDEMGEGTRHAEALARAGIPWVRDRMWWDALQPENQSVDWKWYPKVAETFREKGIRICQIWHTCPEWLMPKEKDIPAPGDIRQYYIFAKEMAKNFGDVFQAYEPGNEADFAGSHWMGRADRYAAYIKAASLGVKSVRPDAILLNGSMCWGNTPFIHNIYESGIGDYTDAFNWHFYGTADQYAPTLRGYREILAQYRAEKRPAWLSEGGNPMGPSSGPNQKDLSLPHQKIQCRNAIRNITMSMMAGNDKYFYFCLSNRIEMGMQFGVAYEDNTFYPSFVGIAALAHYLGVSDFIGTYSDAPQGASVQAFSTPNGTVLIAWAEKRMKLSLPTDSPSIRVANLFGAEKDVAASGGKAVIMIGPDPKYILNVGEKVLAKVTKTTIQRYAYPQNDPSKIVLMGYTTLPYHVDRSCYLFGKDQTTQPIDFMTEVINFDENQTVEGKIWIDVPAGWNIENTKQKIALGPMEKKVFIFKITPAPAKTKYDLLKKVVVRGSFGDKPTSPSVSYFGCDVADIKPVKTEPLPLGNAEIWQPNESSQAPVQAGTNMVKFESKNIQSENDVFSYWQASLGEHTDLRKYDGLAFDIKMLKLDTVRVMLVESSGASYFATISAPIGEKKRVTISFKDMLVAVWFSTDGNFKLDLDNIVAIKIGKEGYPRSFEAGNFELVRFPK